MNKEERKAYMDEYRKTQKWKKSQFQPHMNWTNTEIDHKVPISWFIKETPTQIINDLRNLHPLLKEENGKKSATFCHSISFEYFNEIFPYIKEECITQIKSPLSL